MFVKKITENLNALKFLIICITKRNKNEKINV